MKKLDSKHRYDFASRFVFFACGVGIAFAFWMIQIFASIGGGAWPLIDLSKSSFLLFLNLYGFTQLAVPIIPFFTPIRERH